MSEWKVTALHRSRAAVIYVRQSTLLQVEHNRESTARQYDLVSRARELGWPGSAVTVIDEDLGLSGASAAGRTGFAELAARVGMGQVGIVLALEVSRLARNNTDWYRLLDLAGMTDTLIADADGVYHPAVFNDRLVLGLKGTIAESELHILRARLDGGIRNKAARGELRRGLPVGLAWGEADGEIVMHPDEAVTGVIAAIFDRFAVCGSVRGTWLWLRDQGLKVPLQPGAYVRGSEIIWTEPTYHAVHNVLTHPAYAGAYTFGRSRQERYAGQDGTLRIRRRVLPQDQWEVLQLKLAGDGELLLRGPIVMKGYRNDPARTAEAIDPGGWLHTGDLATIDEDGYVTITGRKKELIINAAGKNMSPAAIESAVLAASLLIAQVVAVGDRRPYIVALIALDPDAAAAFGAQHGITDPAPAILADHPAIRAAIGAAVEEANGRLSRVEQIKRFAIVPAFWEPGGDEITPTMKLKRRAVTAKYADVIESLYAAAGAPA
jgi:DNA invertase Pin-like site-specific DNA recombinase